MELGRDLKKYWPRHPSMRSVYSDRLLGSINRSRPCFYKLFAPPSFYEVHEDSILG